MLHLVDLHNFQKGLLKCRSIVINPSVCASVCLSVGEHNSGTAGPIDTKFCCAQIHCGRGSVLLRRRCATLYTSGFMDDVTFGRNGRDAERWRLTRYATAINGVAIHPYYSKTLSYSYKDSNVSHFVCIYADVPLTFPVLPPPSRSDLYTLHYERI